MTKKFCDNCRVEMTGTCTYDFSYNVLFVTHGDGIVEYASSERRIPEEPNTTSRLQKVSNNDQELCDRCYFSAIDAALNKLKEIKTNAERDIVVAV